MIFRLSFISALGNIVSSISKVHSFCLKFVCTLVVMFYLDKVVHVCAKALELISDPKLKKTSQLHGLANKKLVCKVPSQQDWVNVSC